MKKLLLTLLLLLSLGFAASAAGTDVLTNASLNNGNNTNSGGYKAFTSGVFESGAQYAGKVNFLLNTGTYYFALNNGNANASDIVTTKSGGLASRVTITWTTKVSTSNGRVVKIYGQHDAYTSGDKAQGTEIGSATKGTSASETIELTDKSFEYIAVSAASAVNLESIEIEWIDASGSEREKIDLVQDNLVVKAGDVVLEDEEEVELDANTVVAFAYTTDVENADIAYSYSINGEDAIDGKSYTFTGEEDVIFTATATSNNEVSKTVYLLKKYPTECPTPSFSVADGAEVYAGQIINVKAEGAESILLEANGDLQDGTSYTVAGEPGDVITLYALASVTGKNGAITAENSINVTVVEATEATFTFAGENANSYGLTPQTNGSTYETEVTEIASGIVTITFDGDKYRYWASDKTLRVQSGTSFTVSVPEEYYITKINFDGTSTSTVDNGTFKSGTWTGEEGLEVSSVKFSPTATTKITKITISYAKVPETELVGFTHEESFGRTVVRVEYMLHLNNHKDANEYTVELTVGGMTFSNTEHSDASIVEEAANAPMRALNPDDVASETTLKGTILATGLEAEKEYGTAGVAVKLGDKEIHNATIENFTTGTTGIEDVTVEGEAAAEYFNLQGVRVAEPRAGQIYIVRRGAKATKELVK